MKTLDEVITANECCDHGEFDSRCEDCPYNGIGACCAEREFDTLYYLKMYRSDKAMWEADRKGHLDWIEQYKEAREKHQQAVIELKKNPPLTWDELKDMEGKPVWVEGTILLSHWLIIDTIDEYMMVCSDRHRVGVPLFADVLGKCWQAYRKERTE